MTSADPFTEAASARISPGFLAFARASVGKRDRAPLSADRSGAFDTRQVGANRIGSQRIARDLRQNCAAPMRKRH